MPGGDGAPDRGTVGLNVRSPAGYILPTSWLAPQYTTPSAARAERIANELVKRGLLEPLPRLGALIAAAESGAARLAEYPVTLLHNDAYPPNTAMPVDGIGEAVLVDWAMAGWGFAEVDLAYLFMLPFGNTNRLGREEALACYWAQRDRLDGYLPSAGAREEAQRYADALVALGFLPLAHRAADEPFPPGTAARAYWDGMFTVLNRQLQHLSAAQ